VLGGAQQEFRASPIVACGPKRLDAVIIASLTRR
jgi:hypothetical protein